MFYKNTTISLLSVAVFFLSVACDFDQPPVEKEQQIKPVFSDKNEKIGQVTYKALLKTVRQTKREGVSLKDKEAIEQLAYAHSLEELRAVHLISEDEFLQAQATPKPQILLGATADKTVDTTQKLSPSAQKILSKLQKAVAESPTYEDFTKKLVAINQEIPLTVPAKEQEAVQRGIAIIHYSLEAIDALDKEGLLKNTHKTKKVDKAGFFSFLQIGGGVVIFKNHLERRLRSKAYQFARSVKMSRDKMGYFANHYVDKCKEYYSQYGNLRDEQLILYDLWYNDYSTWWDRWGRDTSLATGTFIISLSGFDMEPYSKGALIVVGTTLIFISQKY